MEAMETKIDEIANHIYHLRSGIRGAGDSAQELETLARYHEEQLRNSISR